MYDSWASSEFVGVVVVILVFVGVTLMGMRRHALRRSSVGGVLRKV